MSERNLDFDKVIDRRNTRCLKYDFAKRRGMPEDVLPLWVADMDFATSSYIEDALIERAKHGIFGYSEVQTPYFEILENWLKKHHNWDVQEKWLIKTPGVVFALAMAVKAYTEIDEGILIQAPVYYPFYEVIRDNGRKIVENELYLGDDNRYHIDFEDFEDKIFRAMGTLKMARKLTAKEFYNLISLVRLGISMGSFDEKYETVSRLLHDVGTATIMSESDEGLTVDDTEKIRAQYVRESLA